MLGAPGAQSTLKNQWDFNRFEVFLEGGVFAQYAPKRRRARVKVAGRTEGAVFGEDERGGK